MRTHWLLLLVIAAGAVARLTNLNWDQGGRLHPDEALIINGAQSLRFPAQWFPGFHDYNGFSSSLVKIIAPTVTSAETLTVIGRFLSALLSTTSIILIYALGTTWWNARAGTYAAILLAASPLFIQLAHFYTTESIMVFLILAMLLAWPSPVFMALPMGLLLATKNTAYLILPLPGALLAAAAPPHFKRTFTSLAVFFLLTALVFFLGSPYSFLDVSNYISRSRYLSAVVSGNLRMDWTLQFQGTTGWFWIPSFVAAAGIAPFLGLIGMVAALISRAKRTTLITVSLWSIGFLIVLGSAYLKFIRYAAPVLPFLLLFAAKTLSDLWEAKHRVFSLSFLLLHSVFGLMFFSIYTTPHTSLEASLWIARHIPDKSRIIVEEWNSIIRFSRPQLSHKGLAVTSFNFYAPDTAAKAQRVKELFSGAQYVIVESPKVRNTVLRLRQRYPHTAALYEQLENGRLGFSPVAHFTSYPRLGPFSLNDEGTEETFTVFDHPAITIYRNVLGNSVGNTVP